MKHILAIVLIITFLLSGCADASVKVSKAPLDADGQCPTFKPRYPKCEVTFGNEGLSVLNSFYETFVGEGAFEIYEFTTETNQNDALIIAAKSNRGELKSEIIPDRLVRIGQDREDEKLFRTHQVSYCNAGRIYEQQIVYKDSGDFNIQDLSFWTENDEFRFSLDQNGSKTARVKCK